MDFYSLYLAVAVLMVAFWGLRIILVLLQIFHQIAKIHRTLKDN